MPNNNPCIDERGNEVYHPAYHERVPAMVEDGGWQPWLVEEPAQ